MSKLLEQINKSSYQLRDLTSLISRGIAPRYVSNDGITVLNQKCIRDWTVSYFNSRQTEKNKINGTDKMLQEGDILICSTGVGTLGRVAQINTLNQPTTVDSHVSIVRPETKKVNPFFLGYILKKSEKLIESLAEGSTGQTELSRTKLQEIEFKLPSREIQDEVVGIIENYDSKIENNNKIIKNLEATAQTIFNEWFTNFRFPGYEKVKMVESEMGKIPEGWEAFKLRDLFIFVKGKKPVEVSETQREGFLQQILIDSFENGKKFYADKQGMIVASDEDLLMVMDGASSGRIEFGITGIVGSTMSKLQLHRPIRSILYFYLKSKQEDIKDNTSGSAIPHTDKEKVYGYEIAIPKNTEYFERILLSFIKGVEKLNHENLSLKLQRDQLLTKLI